MISQCSDISARTLESWCQCRINCQSNLVVGRVGLLPVPAAVIYKFLYWWHFLFKVFYDLYEKDKERYQRELSEYESNKEKDNESKPVKSESQQPSVTWKTWLIVVFDSCGLLWIRSHYRLILIRTTPDFICNTVSFDVVNNIVHLKMSRTFGEYQ